MKQCKVDVAEAVWPERETAFENINMSKRTTVRCAEEINSDFVTHLHDTVQAFMYFAMLLDNSTKASDKPYLYKP
jgi:hypothetical protein